MITGLLKQVLRKFVLPQLLLSIIVTLIKGELTHLARIVVYNVLLSAPSL